MHRPIPTAAGIRTSAVLATAVVLALASPASANAHVSLQENTATPGSYTTLTFRVPNEAVSASTNKVTVTLPSDTRLFASVSYIPVAGWTTELVTTPLPTSITTGNDTVTRAVTQVIWTATPGFSYGQGSQGIFQLFVGPVPDVGKITLPIDQGYSDGSVVSWQGGPDSEDPAPVLYIGDSAPAATDPDSAPVTVTAAAPTAGPDIVARTLGGVGLVLGAIALVIALVGRRPRAAVAIVRGSAPNSAADPAVEPAVDPVKEY